MKKPKKPGKYVKSLRALASRLGRDKGSVARKMKQPGAPTRTARGFNVAACEAFLAREDAEFSRLRNERWSIRNERERIALGRESGEYIPRAQVLSAVQTLAANLKAALYKELTQDLPPKLQALDAIAIAEKLRAACERITVMIHTRPSLWTAVENSTISENQKSPIGDKN